MGQIFCDGGGYFNGTLLIDGLNCTEDGTTDSLSSSDDRFNLTLSLSYLCTRTRLICL